MTQPYASAPPVRRTRPSPGAAVVLMTALLAGLWLLEGRRPAERRATRPVRHPGPRDRRPGRHRDRAVPARRLGPPDQQLAAVLGARLPGAARRTGPLGHLLADQHPRLRPGRLGAHSGRHDHRRGQRSDLRLAHLPAGPRPVVTLGGPDRGRRRRAGGLRQSDLGCAPRCRRCVLAGPSRWRDRRCAGGLAAAPASGPRPATAYGSRTGAELAPVLGELVRSPGSSWARASASRTGSGLAGSPPTSAQNRSSDRAISETPSKPKVPADPASWCAVRSAAAQPAASRPRSAASSRAAPRSAVRVRFVRRACAVMVDSTLVIRSEGGGSAGAGVAGEDWSLTRPTP